MSQSDSVAAVATPSSDQQRGPNQVYKFKTLGEITKNKDDIINEFTRDSNPKYNSKRFFSELNFERTMFFSGILNRLFKKSRIINGYRIRLIEKSLKSRSNLHKGKVVKEVIEVVALK